MSRRSTSTEPTERIVGTVRLGHDPRVLARSLGKGHIAVIDRTDLDAASAEALAHAAPVAVVNASESLSGRFASRGAQRLLELGIPLFDANRAVLGMPDGVRGQIDIDRESGVLVLEASGLRVGVRRVSADDVDQALAYAKDGASRRAPELVAGALDLIYRDGAALVEGPPVRGLDLDLAGKDVLVVSAGAGMEADLAALRTAVKERHMVVIATGEAANTVAVSHRIGVIVGPFDGVQDDVIKNAGVVVVHGESHAAAATRLGALGVRYVSSDSRLESADLAVAIAASAGARTIATVGMATTLPELVESARGASALLARVAAGQAWIDGRMLARLHRSRWSRTQTWILVVVAVGALAGALTLHPDVQDLMDRLLGSS